MSIDWAEIAEGMAGARHDLRDILWSTLVGMAPWALTPGVGRAA